MCTANSFISGPLGIVSLIVCPLAHSRPEPVDLVRRAGYKHSQRFAAAMIRTAIVSRRMKLPCAVESLSRVVESLTHNSRRMIVERAGCGSESPN